MHKLPVFLASALLLGSAVKAQADVVKLTTALPVGENLQIALNADMQVELEWGNGDKQTLTGKGVIESIPVKNAELTISTTVGKLTDLYLSNNELTLLNLSEAPHLQNLMAANNRLEAVSLMNQTALVSLDLHNNLLHTLTVNKATELKNINVAGNEIGNITFATAARPEAIVAVDNQLANVPAAAVLSQAKTLWLNNNRLKALNLSQSVQLVSLFASHNSLATLTLPELPAMTDIWVDNNELKTIDLSKGLGCIYTLAVDHNKLTEVTWDKGRRTLKYAYMDNNALFSNSLPTVSALTHYSIVPQEDYDLGTNYYDLNQEVELSPLFSRNGWNAAIYSGNTYKLVDKDGKELVKDTDYKTSSRNYTFLTKREGVRFEVSGKAYPDVTFVTKRFNVGIETGVHDVVAGTNGLDIHAANGGLQVTAAVPTVLHIYNAAGACLVNETIGQGSHHYALPAGVYVVNGEKAIVR